jgi:hypothetical protein
MGLIKKNSDKKPPTVTPSADGTIKGSTTGAFEESPEASNTATAVGSDANGGGTGGAAASPAPAVSASRAVAAAPAPGAVTIAPSNLANMNVIKQYENQYRVDWNTVDRIQANNGQFLDKGDNNKPMGAEIQLRLMSWQASWQVSPGRDDEESKQFVRYSDDGLVTTKGEDINEYLHNLRTKLGLTNAKLDHRVRILGELVGAEKDSRLEGKLVQIDLSKTSKDEFDKYMLNTAFRIGKGLLAKEAAELMTMRAEPTSWKGKNWTIVKFEPTILADA